MINELLTAAVLLTFTMMCGCNHPSDDHLSTPGVVIVEDDNPEMIAAIKTAKETLGFFENNWTTMKNDGCSLKFALPTSDGEWEHIWFLPTTIQGDKITGECANHPAKIPGLKIGDIRTVTRGDISDWMIIVGDKCFGGYTIRALAKQDPDAAPPFEFMDPPEK